MTPGRSPNKLSVTLASAGYAIVAGRSSSGAQHPRGQAPHHPELTTAGHPGLFWAVRHDYEVRAASACQDRWMGADHPPGGRAVVRLVC